MNKVCCKCKLDKPTEDFHKNRCRRDGLQATCKVCLKAWVDANKEKVDSYKKKWASLNRPRLNEIGRKYHITHREIRNEKNKIWIANNREKYNETQRAAYHKRKLKKLSEVKDEQNMS